MSKNFAARRRLAPDISTGRTCYAHMLHNKVNRACMCPPIPCTKHIRADLPLAFYWLCLLSPTNIIIYRIESTVPLSGQQALEDTQSGVDKPTELDVASALIAFTIKCVCKAHVHTPLYSIPHTHVVRTTQSWVILHNTMLLAGYGSCASKLSTESMWSSHYSLTYSSSTSAWEPMWSLVPYLHTYHENDLLKVDKRVAEHYIIKLPLCTGSNRGGQMMPDSNPTAAECVPTSHRVLATM